ncbi:MAG: hypothetical protein M1360_01980 [Candidatus Marsarchaeota archaeon]|jgi:predicted transcriptional regulator|nr:hypothetical protein [Candidatus Marsarchaeota archaeon]MCL5418690.1 hypothetical protein [Candidatus Marsarchaeota archaeon]
MAEAERSDKPIKAADQKPEPEQDSEMLFKRKQLLIILALKDSAQGWYISTLAKAAGATYVHTCNFLKECEKRGITTSEKHGKIKLVKLTEKGMKLADMLNGAYAALNEPVQQAKKEA